MDAGWARLEVGCTNNWVAKEDADRTGHRKLETVLKLSFRMRETVVKPLFCMWRYECKALCKESTWEQVKPFDQKSWHYFSGFIILTSVSSHQHTFQLAHRSPGTEQSTSWVTEARVHWAYIHWLEGAALTHPGFQAPSLRRQYLCGHRLRCSFNTPSGMCSNFNSEHCRKWSWNGKQCGRVCHILVALYPQCCWPVCSGQENRRTSVTLMGAGSEWL